MLRKIKENLFIWKERCLLELAKSFQSAVKISFRFFKNIFLSMLIERNNYLSSWFLREIVDI